jgi:hypothetical protein
MVVYRVARPTPLSALTLPCRRLGRVHAVARIARASAAARDRLKEGLLRVYILQRRLVFGIP